MEASVGTAYSDLLEMTKKKKCRFLTIILSALVIALVLRAFVFESYKMPSPQMEDALLKGDYLFVNKFAYGVRMPITWLSFPFVPDYIPAWGIKTYSPRFPLPYTRIFERGVERNDVVLYNIPLLQKDLPIDKLPLSISRCTGLPGDSIEVLNHKLFIPKRGYALILTPEKLHIYGQIILGEQKSKATIENGILYINNKPVSLYIFKSDYYWMMGDNTEASADSRHFGFIPKSHIVGKVELIWKSKDLNRIFSRVH